MQGNILRSVGVLQCHTGPQKSYSKTWDVLVGDASKHWVTSPGTAMQPPPTVSHRSQSGFHQETSKEQMQISGMRISGQRRSRDKWTSNNLPAIGSGIHIARCPNLGLWMWNRVNILLLSSNFQVSFINLLDLSSKTSGMIRVKCPTLWGPLGFLETATSKLRLVGKEPLHLFSLEGAWWT